MLTEELQCCPVCYDDEPIKQTGIVGLSVMCRKPNCVANFPLPFAIWQSIPRFPSHVDTTMCQHCEMMNPGEKHATPFDRANALELISTLQEGDKISKDAFELIKKCVRSPRNWKYCDTKDCAIVGAELATAKHYEQSMNAWKAKATAAEAQIEKILRQGLVSFAKEAHLQVSDTILLPPCPRCDELPEVDGFVVRHYEECDDQGEHGKGQLVTYTPAEWWMHVASLTYCKSCLRRPGFFDEYDEEPDDDVWDDEEGTWYHQCNMEQSSTYTPQDWWFENTSLKTLADMGAHGEQLLSRYLDSLRGTKP